MVAVGGMDVEGGFIVTVGGAEVGIGVMVAVGCAACPQAAAINEKANSNGSTRNLAKNLVTIFIYSSLDVYFDLGVTLLQLITMPLHLWSRLIKVLDSWMWQCVRTPSFNSLP
jgi:hypothetical protein